MSRGNSRNRQFNQLLLVIMGCVWIAFALFGLVFDPEKRVIIISQIGAGGLCFLVYIVMKRKKTKG